jgi:hypothetical protein
VFFASSKSAVTGLTRGATNCGPQAEALVERIGDYALTGLMDLKSHVNLVCPHSADAYRCDSA